MKVYEERFLTLEVEQSKNCLIQHWRGTVTSDEYRRGQKKTVEVFKQYHLKNLISNTKEAGALKTEDTQWAVGTILPQLTSSGLKSLNMVVPQNVFTKLTLQDIENKSKTAVDTKIFSSVDEALKAI